MERYEHSVRGGEVLERAKDLRCFDEQASVRMLREDILKYGSITPETQSQVYNEELSYIAEGLNAPLRTRFVLHTTENGLVDERGVPLSDVLDRGRHAAEMAVLKDSHLRFNLTRAIHDHEEGEELNRMMEDTSESAATTVISVSPFCEEAYRQYGAQYVESVGYQSHRKMGFIRVYNKIAADQLEVLSLSVDNSNLAAFREVLQRYDVAVPLGASSDDYASYRVRLSLDQKEQMQIPQQLVYEYDNAMRRLFNQEFTAGRLASHEIEAWKFITSQKDLLEYYFNKLETIARHAPDDYHAKRELTYGFWATLKDRLKRMQNAYVNSDEDTLGITYFPPHTLEQEVKLAYKAAALRHERLVGCGGSTDAETQFSDMEPDDAFTEIMSDKAEILPTKRGVCRVEGCPTHPGKTIVGPCGVCMGKCQKLFDQGRDPAEVYAKQRKTPSIKEVA